MADDDDGDYVPNVGQLIDEDQRAILGYVLPRQQQPQRPSRPTLPQQRRQRISSGQIGAGQSLIQNRSSSHPYYAINRSLQIVPSTSIFDPSHPLYNVSFQQQVPGPRQRQLQRPPRPPPPLPPPPPLLPPPPPLAIMGPAAALINGISALSFKQYPFITFMYSQFLVNLLTQPLPTLGRIFKIEYIVKAEVNDFIQFDPCEFQSFFYLYLCAKTLGDLRTLTFERFLKAILYIGKGNRNRELEHLKPFSTGAGSGLSKLMALSELLSRDGVIIQRNNTFISEHLSLNYEGGGIELMDEQLTNSDPREFPGLELNTLNGKYVTSLNHDRQDPRKFVLDLDMNFIKQFGFHTLVRAFYVFKESNHFVVTLKNCEEVYENRNNPITVTVDKNDAFSKINSVQSGKLPKKTGSDAKTKFFKKNVSKKITNK